MNSIDNKFGLPKPDFQELRQRKVIWPVLVMVTMVGMLILVKMGYDFYRKMDAQKHVVSQTANTSVPLAHSSQEKFSGSGGQSVSNQEVFEHTKNAKVKESISATQQQLVEKQNKPLVKPGTYQELKEPQGIYHLVVLSHLEKRAAMKVVGQLIKQKLGVCLILPRVGKKEKYYRVTIGHSKTQYEANEKLKTFKSIYPNIFILKY